MKIYLIRHGETEENLKKSYYGDIDCTLTEKGRAQGKKLRLLLDKIAFDKVFSSEKKRAKETLELIYKGKYEEDKRLNERSFGIFEGLTYKELESQFEEELQRWNEDWINYTMEGGESFRMFYQRVKEFMEDLAHQDIEKVLISTHGGVIRAIYTYIFNDKEEVYWRFASRNGDLSIINYEDGYFYIDSIFNMELL